jgi:hypothetical protein
MRRGPMVSVELTPPGRAVPPTLRLLPSKNTFVQFPTAHHNIPEAAQTTPALLAQNIRTTLRAAAASPTSSPVVVRGARSAIPTPPKTPVRTVNRPAAQTEEKTEGEAPKRSRVEAAPKTPESVRAMRGLPLDCRTASPSPAANNGSTSMHFVQSFAPPAYPQYGGYAPSATFHFDPCAPPYHGGLPQMPHLG